MHTCKKPFSKLHDAARLAVASEIEPQFDHDEVSKGQNQRDSLYGNVIDFPHFQSGSPFAAHGKIHDSTKNVSSFASLFHHSLVFIHFFMAKLNFHAQERRKLNFHAQRRDKK